MSGKTTEQQFLEELGYAMGENGAPFALDDVESVEPGYVLDFGDYAETTISGVVRLKDGRRFKVEGWCDTTGWDCQSGLECELLPPAGNSAGNFSRNESRPGVASTGPAKGDSRR